MASVGQLAVHDSVKWETHRVAGVPVRLYRPADVDRDKILPVLIYYHGGGFVVGSIGKCNELHAENFAIDIGLMLVSHIYPMATQ